MIKYYYDTYVSQKSIVLINSHILVLSCPLLSDDELPLLEESDEELSLPEPEFEVGSIGVTWLIDSRLFSTCEETMLSWTSVTGRSDVLLAGV